MNIPNKRKVLALVAMWVTLAAARADFIAADFRTTKGNFTMLLDYYNSPLAVANFIQLAGKSDDILETPPGVPVLGSIAHSLRDYLPTPQSDVQRLPLRVAFIPRTERFRAYYGIFQNQTQIGGVEQFASRGFHRDITGEDLIRLSTVSFNPLKYRITLRYPRPWLDARDLRVKEAPMYRVMKIHRIEQGRRFFAGTMTDNRLEHPGYHFQDEVTQNPGNLDNPYGIPFNTPGVLAMDTLAPNRNGSGFFITSIADPSLNGRCTAFGRVLSSLDLAVVRNIANSNLNSEGKPSEDIYIIDVKIRRSGPTAVAFMEGFEQRDLPGKITPLPLSIEREGGSYFLVPALRRKSQNAIYSSPDLRDFSGGFLGSQGPETVGEDRTDITNLVELFPSYYFKAFSTRLPTWPSADFDLSGARLFFSVNSGLDRGNLNLAFDLTGTGGSYEIDMVVERTVAGGNSVFERALGAGTFVAAYDSSHGPFEGRLTFSNLTGPLNADRLTLHFDSDRLANNPQADPSLRVRRFDAARTNPQVPFLNYSGVFRKLK